MLTKVIKIDLQFREVTSYMRLLSSLATASFFIMTGVAGVSAQDIEDFKKCAAIQDDTLRLSCFDSASKSIDTRPSATGKSRAALEKETARLRIETATLKKEATRLKAEKLALVKDTKAANKKVAKLEVAVEQAKPKDSFIPEGVVTNIIKRRNGLRRIYLDNGQVWDQTDSSHKLSSLKVGRTVVLKTKSFGSFILKVKGTNRTMKVKRKL